jgi:hypothetical protein
MARKDIRSGTYSSSQYRSSLPSLYLEVSLKNTAANVWILAQRSLYTGFCLGVVLARSRPGSLIYTADGPSQILSSDVRYRDRGIRHPDR